MGLEQIGLQAILDDKNFQAGLKRYTDGVGKMEKSTDAGASAISRIGSVISGTLAVGIGVGVAAIGAFTAASKLGLDTTLAWAEQLDKLGDVFGLSGEDASAWAFLMNRVGVSVEEGGQQLNYFTKNLADVGAKATPFTDALKKLGIDGIDPVTGKVKDFNTIMPEVLDAFSKLPAGVDASALAMDLFGARGGSKFLDLLRQGSGGLEDARKKADELGLTLSTDTVNAAEQFGFKLNELNLGLEGIKNQIGVAVLPVVSDLVDKINNDVIPAFAAWAKDNAPKVKAALQDVGDWIAKNGPAIAAGMQEGFSAFEKWWTEHRLTETIIAGLTDLKTFLEKEMPPAIETFKAAMAENAEIRDEWIKFLSEIRSATQDTFRGLNSDASIQMPTLAQMIGNALDQINARSAAQLGTLRGAWAAATSLIRGDFSGFSAGISQMSNSMMQSLLSTVGLNLAELRGRFAIEFAKVVNYLGTLPSQFERAASAMVDGLISGFWSRAGDVQSALSGIINGAIDAIKQQLGIASPSKVFEKIGQNMAEGMLGGFATPELTLTPAVMGQIGASSAIPVYTNSRSAVTNNNQRSFSWSGNLVMQFESMPSTPDQASAQADLVVSALRSKGFDV